MMKFGGQGSEPYIPSSYRPLTPPTTSRPPSIFNASPPHLAPVKTSFERRNANKEKVGKLEDALPTPRQSLDGEWLDGDKRKSLMGNFLQLYDKVKGDPRKEEGRLENVDEQDFEWLKIKGEEGEIEGWNSIRLASE